MKHHFQSRRLIKNVVVILITYLIELERLSHRCKEAKFNKIIESILGVGIIFAPSAPKNETSRYI